MSAPTTAEVRHLVGARLAMMRAADIKDGGGAVHQAYAWALTETALPIAEHRDALAAEVARLKAQTVDLCEAAADTTERMAAEVARLREALAIACHWWGGCGHHYDDCPVDDAGELVETECAEARRVDELAAKGAGR